MLFKQADDKTKRLRLLENLQASPSLKPAPHGSPSIVRGTNNRDDQACRSVALTSARQSQNCGASRS